MRRLLPQAAPLAILDVAGGSYVGTIGAASPPVGFYVLGADGGSNVLLVSPETTDSALLLDASGAAFRVGVLSYAVPDEGGTTPPEPALTIEFSDSPWGAKAVPSEIYEHGLSAGVIGPSEVSGNFGFPDFREALTFDEDALQLRMLRSFLYGVRSTVSVQYGVRVVGAVPTSYRHLLRVFKPLVVDLSPAVRVFASVPVSYQSLRTITRVLVPVVVGYAHTTRAFRAVVCEYSLLEFNRVIRGFGVRYLTTEASPTQVHPARPPVALPDGTVISSGTQQSVSSQYVDVFTVEPVIVVDGGAVQVQSLTISVEEGQTGYTCSAKLASYTDMRKFPARKEFYVVLEGEVYTFIVDSRAINREEVNAPESTLRGVSPTNKLTGAYSKQIIGITVDKAKSALEIAQLLLYDPKINRAEIPAGDALQWEILDWAIPPYRFGVENQYPLDAVRLLATAAGGVVESTPDGNIRVRYKHPVAVPAYGDDTASHVFIDERDILSIQEHHAPNKQVNSVYVKTYQDIGVSDTVEFFDVNQVGGALPPAAPGVSPWKLSGGFVRVFPAVWRDVVKLFCTNSTVRLEYLGVEEWIPNAWQAPDYGWEQVEVVRSQASCRYPVDKVLGYGYLSENAGEIITQDYSRTIYTSSEAVRFSLLRLKYSTRCHLWRLSAPPGTHLQLCVEDNVFSAYLR